MVGWHHGLNGHEFEQALRDGKGQGGLTCSQTDGRELMTEQQHTHCTAVSHSPHPPSSWKPQLSFLFYEFDF